MTEGQEIVSQESELSLELFNVSNEFEDIEFAIDDLTGQAQLEVAARRC